MITTLYIRDYAIIDELTVEFSDGLNIITGETGAGKSIVIDALGLLLGERASSDDVRGGASKAVIEGFFSIMSNDRVHTLLRDNGYDDESEELIIRREIPSRGSSRAFLNDSPAPIALLKEIGFGLIDLHGQHDHQLLLRPDTHCGLLDNAGGLEGMVREYADAFADVAARSLEIRQLQEREEELRRTLEFHEFQLNEIIAVDPKDDEIDTLLREITIRENGEQLYELVSGLHAILYEENGSVRDKLLRARSMFDRLVSIDPTFADRREECVSAIVIVEEIAKSLQSYSVSIDFSSAELDRMRERLQELNGLRKKFGGTLEAVIEHRDRITQEIELARNYDSTIAEKVAALRKVRETAGALAWKLSKKRKEIAKRVEESVVTVLKELGIEHARFVVSIEQHETTDESDNVVVHRGHLYEATRSGVDTVEFFISTNLGEDVKPLARTASGGEISRVMLALKSILAKNDRLPLLVFDEIDTGISGRIATKVGAAMRNLADFHQIIAITHLPQIAAMSRHHYVVEKLEKDKRTVTTMRKLTREEHTEEVAKLVSGEDVTASSLQAARDLIES